STSFSLAVEEIKTESDAVDGMEVSMPPKAVPDLGSAEQALAPQKRKAPSPPHSSNGHSPSDTSPSPTKKKKKPGLVNSSKDQCELRHGPFYYVKQPALTTDPVDVVPQDGRNDFYCWVCHREGQVLCCELCPRVYHAKCLKLAAEPEGDWFCPECEKITVAECIETQSKAMTMLNLEQLSYLLKFALQKMKQPGTEPFQKPVSLEQHPDYAEYIFHPMDLCTLEKNIKKKMYGCTEAFLADMKWILHNCIIYNGGNHKLTATAKVIVKICEHEMNEIEVCPECYLSACQKRDNWFCEPCSQPHPLVWAKLKGFPFWPAKALRDKDGQVDARFFGQHDRAWVPLNNCYLMSKEIPFSVKKTKSIFNSAMQEMEVYVENVRKKYGVFNYAPFRTPYTPNNQFQMLQDPNNPKKGTVKPEKQDKVKFSFDMTASPKMLLSKTVMSGGPGQRISVTDVPRSPMSTNSSVHTGSDLEQDERGPRVSSSHYSGEDSMDCTASPASVKTSNSPKPLLPTPVKQERSSGTGGILNLNLDRIKAEMDLKELSETVQQQQQQGTSVLLTSPKKPTRSLDKTIESCKAQLGNEHEHTQMMINNRPQTMTVHFFDNNEKSFTSQLHIHPKTNIFSMVIIIMQLNLYRAHNVVSVVSPAVQHKDTSPVNMGSGTSTSCLAGDFLTPPSSADVAADIAKYTTKMMDVIKGTMTEIYNDLSKSTTGNTIAEIRRLRIEIEKLQWLHQQELSEMKHNLELTMAEMRQSLEQERERLVSEVKKQMEMEKQQAVDETKKKQWCANCKKEAIFYCCWNTSYCDYPCQQAHWPEHMKSCTQSATATQQEAETEASSDAAGKPVGQSPKTQPSPTGERTSPANRGPSPLTDNNKGSSSVAVS
uniref:Protein kinase C binding protein 1, like n=1 Tax=Cyprinus carpio TaxID=7962 RepID=A0A8C2ICY7_CYPCA